MARSQIDGLATAVERFTGSEVNGRLFTEHTGESKLTKRDRDQFVEYVGATILQPDAAYEVVEPQRDKPGATRKVRRFLRLFSGDPGGQIPIVAVFVWDEAVGVFTGATAFAAFNARDKPDIGYYERQKRGDSLK